MPPLPAVTDVIKYTQLWTVGANAKASSIFHFKYSGGPPNASDCTALAATFQAAMVTQFKPLMGANYWVGLGTVLDLNSNTGAAGTGGTATQGTRTGAALSGQNCCVITHQIARRYRGGKPRSYFPIGNETDVNTVGTWGATFVAAVQSAINAWVVDALAASSGSTTITQYGSVSYYLNKALRATPEWDPILESLVRQRFGTQRRRIKTA